jgi:hypothetical protein
VPWLIRLRAIDPSATAGTAVVVLVCSVPLALTVWALLDAARRPEWAWALAGRRRVVWLAAILFGAMTLAFGLVVSTAYLLWVRPAVAAAEAGRIDLGAGRAPRPGSGSGPGDPNSPGGGGP